MADAGPQVETVLCIPGHWQNPQHLTRCIAQDSQGYLFAGRILTAVKTKEVFELQVEDPDPRLSTAFRAAGGHWVTEDDVAAIQRHSLVLYLIGTGGSRDDAESIMAAGAALLRAGGYAVKVESAGIAHSAKTWFQFVEQRYLFSAHRAFLMYVTSENVYSCGMHNLGYPDAIVAQDAAHDPVELVRIFTWYLFTEQPTILEGQTFSTAPDAPVYRLQREECDLYDGDPMFTNPFGMWRLRPTKRDA